MKVINGRILSVFSGDSDEKVQKNRKSEVEFSFEGVSGDRHCGFTKLADVRDKPVPKYINGERHCVRNWRQWSAVSEEELTEIADDLRIGKIDAAWLGANFCVSGIPHFTQIPKGSQLWFPSGAILTVEEENEPCIHPGKEISRHIPAGSFEERDFVIHAQHKRGLVGVVYKPGVVRESDEFELHIYEARPYLYE